MLSKAKGDYEELFLDVSLLAESMKSVKRVWKC